MVLILTGCLPHISSLNVGDFSTCFAPLIPIVSFKSYLPPTYTPYIKLASSVSDSTSSRVLCPPQSATNLSTDVTACHSLQQVSPEPGSLLFSCIYSWEDGSGTDCFVVLLVVPTQFTLGTCLPEIDGPETDDCRAHWDSSSIPEVYGLSSADVQPYLEQLFHFSPFLGGWCQTCPPLIQTQSAPMCAALC